MKALKLSVLASTMLLGSFTMNAQNADELLSKHIKAIGGDSWVKVTSMKKTITASAQGMDLQIVETKVKGKGVRNDIAVMGSNNYTIVTPAAGWVYMPIQGSTKAEPVKPEELKMLQPQMEIADDIIGYKAAGTKAEYVGKETIGDKETHKIKLTDKDGDVVTIYLDAATFYKVRETQKAGPAGQEVEVVTNFSDFKKFPEGIVIAMKTSAAQGEQVISDVEINKPVDEKIFTPSN